MPHRKILALPMLAGALLACGSAGAQSMSANSAAYNAGYGRVAGQENQPVEVGVRDANGNLVIVDGIIETGVDFSGFAGAGATAGAGDTVAGAGGGATAIGNNLQVVTQGNDNVVIIDSNQVNTGNISATSSH